MLYACCCEGGAEGVAGFGGVAAVGCAGGGGYASWSEGVSGWVLWDGVGAMRERSPGDCGRCGLVGIVWAGGNLLGCSEGTAVV